MAKTVTGKTSKKGQAAKPKAAPKKARRPAAAKKPGVRKSSSNAADALIKLIESPLVAELLATGASAALATLAAQRFGRKDDGVGTGKALKTAAKAAAAAMGQRLTVEVDEIRKASKPAKGDGAT